jgi:hypothetical protein
MRQIPTTDPSPEGVFVPFIGEFACEIRIQFKIPHNSGGVEQIRC